MATGARAVPTAGDLLQSLAAGSFGLWLRPRVDAAGQLIDGNELVPQAERCGVMPAPEAWTLGRCADVLARAASAGQRGPLMSDGGGGWRGRARHPGPGAGTRSGRHGRRRGRFHAPDRPDPRQRVRSSTGPATAGRSCPCGCLAYARRCIGATVARRNDARRGAPGRSDYDEPVRRRALPTAKHVVGMGCSGPKASCHRRASVMAHDKLSQIMRHCCMAMTYILSEVSTRSDQST